MDRKQVMSHNRQPGAGKDKIWVTQHEGPIYVRDMKRSHVRNSLQWCIRRQDRTILGTDMDFEDEDGVWDDPKDKDGLYYSEWIAIFTARLLDPELGE